MRLENDSIEIAVFDSKEIHDYLEKKKYKTKLRSLGPDYICRFKSNLTDEKEGTSYINPYKIEDIDLLHESDLIVIDLSEKKGQIILNSSMEPEYCTPQIEIKYPRREYASSCLGAYFMKNYVSKYGVFIVFANTYIEERIDLYDFNNCNERIKLNEYYVNNYSFCQENISCSNKRGVKVNLGEAQKFNSVIKKYLSACHYSITFNLSSIKGSTVLPLLFNHEKEVVAFLKMNENGLYIVLPQFKNKEKVVLDIIDTYLPTIKPEIFPDSTGLSWISDHKIILPKHEGYLNKINIEKNRHLETISKIDNEIEENHKRYGFLHEILIDSGDTLVAAVIKLLESFNFDKIINSDQANISRNLNEDIQIFNHDCLIIAEVKGINGVPGDSECTQIAKHRARLQRENINKRVHPIFIVNHQKQFAPWERKVIPFTNEQIQFAKDDERGLLTTWTLFQWYKAIENNIFTAAEIKAQLQQNGDISVIPVDYNLIGNITRYFTERKAFTIDLNRKISCGDNLIFYKNGNVLKGKIESIMVNGSHEQSAAQGQVGVVVDVPLSRGFEVYHK